MTKKIIPQYFHTHEQVDEQIDAKKRAHQCSMCNANYNFKSHLITHMVDFHAHCRNANEKNHPYECPICKETFPLKDSVRKHIEKNHEDEEPAECSICNVNFDKKSELADHLFQIHVLPLFGNKLIHYHFEGRLMGKEKSIFKTNPQFVEKIKTTCKCIAF